MGFKRGEDPKKPMRIGKYKNYLKNIPFSSEEEAIEILIPLLPLILDTEEIPKDIINGVGGETINYKYFKKIIRYIRSYISFGGGSFVFPLFYKLKDMGFPYQP